jgi:hypothetical protein
MGPLTDTELHNQQLAGAIDQFRTSQEKNLTDLKNRQAFFEGEQQINKEYVALIEKLKSMLNATKKKGEDGAMVEKIMDMLAKLEGKKDSKKFAEVQTMILAKSKNAATMQKYAGTMKPIAIGRPPEAKTGTDQLKAAVATNKKLKEQLDIIQKEHDQARELLHAIHGCYLTLAEYRVHMQMAMKKVLDLMGKQPEDGGCTDRDMLDEAWNLNQKTYDGAKKSLEKLELLPF